MPHEWESVIGLEVHVQLLTRAKLFSSAPTAYGAPPNTQACAIDLGLPGVLPVLNEAAMRMAVKFGLAVTAKIAPVSVFARKNYFYPDLPKGYQISQYDLPVVQQGHLDICLEEGEIKRIGITRAHLEEDAGKSLHDAVPAMTGIDLNRAGTPLLEIVSEPDLRSAREAVAYLKTLHALVCSLQICDGNLQEGSFRCDANVSIRPKGDRPFGTRVEIKNINSFRFVEKAINYEIARQIEMREANKPILQETRLYNADRHETRAMRSKEDAHDYRYFPDPDLLPVTVSEELIAAVQATLPELPAQKCQRFQQQYGLSIYEANLLAGSGDSANFFEQVMTALPGQAKLVANWMLGELAAALNKHNLELSASPLTAAPFAGLLQRIADGTLSNNIAKKVFEQMWQTGHSADTIIAEQGLQQITDSHAITKIVQQVIAQFPQQLADYRSGKDKLFGFFVGQVMKATGGKANPQQLNELLQKYLNS